MQKKYPIYKGLDKPLEYKGFKGKYIYWGLGCILIGLILAVIAASVFNIFVAAILLAICIAGGIPYTLSKQKTGQHEKSKHAGLFVHENNMSLTYEKSKKINP